MSKRKRKKCQNPFGVMNRMPNVDANFHRQSQIRTVYFHQNSKAARLCNSIYHVISRLNYHNIPSHSGEITGFYFIVQAHCPDLINHFISHFNTLCVDVCDYFTEAFVVSAYLSSKRVGHASLWR